MSQQAHVRQLLSQISLTTRRPSTDAAYTISVQVPSLLGRLYTLFLPECKLSSEMIYRTARERIGDLLGCVLRASVVIPGGPVDLVGRIGFMEQHAEPRFDWARINIYTGRLCDQIHLQECGSPINLEAWATNLARLWMHLVQLEAWLHDTRPEFSMAPAFDVIRAVSERLAVTRNQEPPEAILRAVTPLESEQVVRVDGLGAVDPYLRW